MADDRSHDDEAPGGGSTLDALAAERAAHQATRAALRLAEERLSSVLHGSAVWVWESDQTHRLTSVLGAEQASWRNAIGKTRFECATDVDDAKWSKHQADLDAHRAFEGFEYLTVRDG
ncbi:MAG: hypothetical protein KDK91_15885, partial [Gammaproteobacteria bacterium]|nr:hypothetical protein [Gammaproteobacteria bacterium]